MPTINQIFSIIGRKFRNFVFRKRLGRRKWSAKLIFLIMGFFDKFEIYSNTGQVGNFDHYVPKLLLRYFKASNHGNNSKSSYCWSRLNNSINRVCIDKICGEANYDISSTNSKPSDYVSRKLFAELLEQKSSYILKRINTNDELDLTYLEESTLAVFMAHQITRVPAFRRYLSTFFSIGYSDGLINYNDFGDKNILRRKVADNTIGITYDQVIGADFCTRIDGGKPQIIMLSLIIASDIAEKIYKGNLHILEVPKNSLEEFVISDNPVIFLDMERKEILRFPPWWEIEKKDFWIFMPISPKKAIFYCKSRKKDGPVENENEDLVRLFNFGQYLCSLESVLGTKEAIIKNHLNLYATEMHRK